MMGKLKQDTTKQNEAVQNLVLKTKTKYYKPKQAIFVMKNIMKHCKPKELS